MTMPDDAELTELEAETDEDRRAADRRLTMDYPVELEEAPNAAQLRREAGTEEDPGQ